MDIMNMTLKEVVAFYEEQWYDAQSKLETAQTNRTEINDEPSWSAWYLADKREYRTRTLLGTLKAQVEYIQKFMDETEEAPSK